MKKTLAILLCALLIAATLAGCGVKDVVQDKLGEVDEAVGDALKSQPTLEKDLPGTWIYTVDFEKFIEATGESDSMNELKEAGVDFSKLNLPMQFTFADGTCTLEITQAAAEQIFQDMKPMLIEAVKATVEKESGMSMEEIEKTLKESGMTWESMIDEGLDYSELTRSDTYSCTVEGDKLNLDGDLVTVKFLGETEMQFTEIKPGENRSDDDSFMEKLLPMTLKKQ